MLYVLGLLLVGKQRKQVQKELAQLQLIPKLSNLFDRQVPGPERDVHRYRMAPSFVDPDPDVFAES